ncbi:MAG TPA: histone deacetylase, partial [Longimicrobiales bacterium]|nr:histone deacetylase [Longimicrobiales bacterium]
TQVSLDADTVVSAASWDAALAAAGCAITAVRLTLGGEVGSAFALSRPPGHHAGADYSMGFCLFNNVAVAARWAQVHHGIGRILIIDWDVHHGNGTQDIFYDDGAVHYLSLHQSPHYPGTGSARERGAGQGLGATTNVPVPAGMSRPAYMDTFREALDQALHAASPELVLISAGMDCLAGDPLGGLRLEPADVHQMTREVVDRARVPVVAVLEGGYAPRRVGLAVVNALRAFAGLPAKD